MERKEPSTSEVAHIGAELALFKGAICERAEISGAFNGAELTLSEYQTGLTHFGPIFGAKSTLLIVQCGTLLRAKIRQI